MEALIANEADNFIGQCINVALDILRMPARQVWINYDKEADVLYMSFRKPQRATETVEMDDDMLLRKDGETIVGLTILNASIRNK